MFSIYKKLGWYFRQEKKRYIAFFLLAVTLSFLETLPPKLLGEALDAIAQGLMSEAKLFGMVAFM